MSVIMSAPGPLVVGLGLLVGKSSTQLADFIRRTIELLSIIFAFVVYSITTKNDNVNLKLKQKLEKSTNVFVASTMIISAIIMLVVSLTQQSSEKGNVISGLVIAILGVTANSIFWIKYRLLGAKTQNNILKTQSSLYRAKTFVDLSVTIALFVLTFSQSAIVSYYFDLIGTICVSVYLGITGTITLYKQIVCKKHDN